MMACHINWHNAVYHVEKANYDAALDVFDNQVCSVVSVTRVAVLLFTLAAISCGKCLASICLSVPSAYSPRLTSMQHSQHTFWPDNKEDQHTCYTSVLQSNDPNQWTGFVLSASTTRLLLEGALHPLFRLSDTSASTAVLPYQIIDYNSSQTVLVFHLLLFCCADYEYSEEE